MTRLASLCSKATISGPVYDREAVGVEHDERFTMFCMAKGVKDTGKGMSKMEAMQEAAAKVILRLEKEDEEDSVTGGYIP